MVASVRAIIDAALYRMSRHSERGRVRRILKNVNAAERREQALALVSRELDERIPAVVDPEIRAALEAPYLGVSPQIVPGSTEGY